MRGGSGAAGAAGDAGGCGAGAGFGAAEAAGAVAGVAAGGVVAAPPVPFVPASSAGRGAGSSRGAGLAAISEGMVTVKVLPAPSSLSTSMVPPMASTSSLAMGMPRPEPLRAASFWARGSCVKGSKSFCRKALLMPRPVSRQR